MESHEEDLLSEEYDISISWCRICMHCTLDENRANPSYDSPLRIYRPPDIEVDTLAAT